MVRAGIARAAAYADNTAAVAELIIAPARQLPCLTARRNEQK